MFGVLLLTGAGNAGGRRVPAAAERFRQHVSRRHPLVARQGARLLPAGPVPGCAVPVLLCSTCAAGREQMRSRSARRHARPRTPRMRWRARCPTPRCSRPSWCSCTSAAATSAARPTVVTMIVFALTLLLMVRQGVVLRSDALLARAQCRAHRRGALRLADRQRLRRDHDRRHGRRGALRLARLRAHPGLQARGDHRQDACRAVGGRGRRKAAGIPRPKSRAAPAGTVGPVELRIERGTAPRDRGRGQQPHAGSGGAAVWRSISATSASARRSRSSCGSSPSTIR